MIIDAHAHIFPAVDGMIGEGPTRGLGYGRVAVGNREIQMMPPLCRRTSHTPEMLLNHMDWAGIEKAVLLQGPFYGDLNRYVLAAIRANPTRLIGLAYLDPWSGGAHRSFDGICRSPEFVGVKIEFSVATGLRGIHAAAKLDDPDIDWIWSGLEQRGRVLVIDAGAIGSDSYQTAALNRIATGHPALTLVIAHLGQPNPAAETDSRAWRQWEKQIDLGNLPNVYFDTASLPAYVSPEGFPFVTNRRYLKRAIARIGPNKIMWGTDIPALLSHATYRQLLEAMQSNLDWLSNRERSLILGGNALRVYNRLPLKSRPAARGAAA